MKDCYPQKIYFFYDEELTALSLLSSRFQFLYHVNNWLNVLPMSPAPYYHSNLLSGSPFVTSNFKILTFHDDTHDISSLYYSYENPIWTEDFDFQKYFYIKNSTFISFFINNMVDVPVCFKKSSSLRSKNFELPLLKFFNLLMRKGKREKILRIVLNNYRLFLEAPLEEEYELLTDVYDFRNSWINFFLLFNSTFFDQKALRHRFVIFDERTELFANNVFLDGNKLINNEDFIKNDIISELEKLSPTFSYFIYNVDKNIRKFSRGKSGKYIFVWKYVAPYKRRYIAMRWIAKEIKFRFEKKFSERIISTLLLLKDSLHLSLAWKSKVFSHNFVFKNFKKSLMSNLKTIAK